jgi:hypothetical protein
MMLDKENSWNKTAEKNRRGERKREDYLSW